MTETQLRYDGRTAIVTGAGGGLGRQYALLLAARGASIVVNDPGFSASGDGQRTDAARTVVDEISALGGTAVANTDSVATAAGGASVVATAIEAFGSVDIVINNAGILRDSSFAKMSPEMFEAVVDVHLLGSFYVTHAAWPHMRTAGYGRVVNTSSNSGLIGNFGQSNYGAAKAGVLGLTRVLSIEGVKYDIVVNAIAPMAATRMTESVLSADIADALNPAAVAPVVAWLVHETCPVTGNVYSAGGGRVARMFIGLSKGYYSPALTVEDIAQHWQVASDTSGATVPDSPNDEIEQLLAMRAEYGAEQPA